MGALAQREVVGAGIHDEGAGAEGVIAGQQAHVHVHGDGLALAGLQRVGLLVVHQLDGGFLHAVGLVVLSIGHGGIELDDRLACRVACVLDGHGGLGGLLVRGHGHLVQGLLKGGVGQAVAEGVHDLLVILPLAVRLGDRAVRGRVGAGGSGLAAVAQHDVRVTGLIIAVAGVDALGLDQVAVHVLISHEVRRVGPRDVARALHGGIHRGVGRHGIAQVRGGRHGAVQHVRHAVEAVGAGEADPQDGVDARVVLEAADLHGVHGVDQHDDLVEVRLRLFDQGDLVLAQAQDVAGLGLHALGQALLAGVVGAALGAGTAHHHDGGVGIVLVILAEVRVQRQHLVHGELMGIVVAGDLRVLGDDAAAEAGLGPLLIGKELLVGRQGGGVQLEAPVLEALGDLHGGVAIGDGAAGGAVHRRVGADAQQGDLRVLRDGQRAALILQQGHRFLALADGEFLQPLESVFSSLVVAHIVPGVLAVRGLGGHDHLAAGVEERVYGGAVGLQDAAAHHRYGQHERKDQRQAAPYSGRFEHGIPPI